jgi:hypothetical protein
MSGEDDPQIQRAPCFVPDPQVKPRNAHCASLRNSYGRRERPARRNRPTRRLAKGAESPFDSFSREARSIGGLRKALREATCVTWVPGPRSARAGWQDRSVFKTSGITELIHFVALLFNDIERRTENLCSRLHLLPVSLEDSTFSQYVRYWLWIDS